MASDNMDELNGVDRDQNVGPMVIEAAVLSSIVSIIAVVLRMIARLKTQRRLNASDSTLLWALVLSLVINGLTIYSVQQGLGRHLVVLEKAQVQNILLTGFFIQILYLICLTILKVSVLLLYYLIFPVATFRIGAWVIGTVAVLWGISSSVATIFACSPVSGAWKIDMDPEPSCMDSNAFYVATAVVNIGTDLAILCLPLRHVWNLKMRKALKWAVTGMFLLGAGVVASSTVRLVLLATSNSRDMTYGYANLGIWGCIELSFAIVSSSTPAFDGAFKVLIPESVRHRFSSWFKGNRYNRFEHHPDINAGMGRGLNDKFQPIKLVSHSPSFVIDSPQGSTVFDYDESDEKVEPAREHYDFPRSPVPHGLPTRYQEAV